MASFKVTQIRSTIGGTHSQRETMRSLGLRKIRQSVVVADRPELLGMVNTVRHLVVVERIADDAPTDGGK